MRVLEHAIDIDRTPEQVWKVLADFDRYDEWNPFITKIDGDAQLGARLTVRIAPPGGRAMTLKPRITELAAHRHLKWLGRLGLPRIFDGAHEFTLQPSTTGTTMTQRETFRGILVPFCGRILQRTGDGFAAMNRALKDRVEQTSG